MVDACCVSDDPDDELEAPERFWAIREVRAAVLAGALLVGGLIADVAGADSVSDLSVHRRADRRRLDLRS